MIHFDVFNGDADGLCALQQLRLHTPQPATLVTGVKRDIALLQRVPSVADAQITVLDISAETNHGELMRLLAAGAEVHYFDHHRSGELAPHPRLHNYIDTHAEICTSLIVNQHLQGRHALWAIAAAFGDNLPASATRVAKNMGLGQTQCDTLRELGIYLNYNAYGETVADLFFDPAQLYEAMHPYSSPLDFVADSPVFTTLSAGYAQDMQSAREQIATQACASSAAYVLPDAAWARRVSGVFANELCNAAPDRAHAILTAVVGGYRVSVRAPLLRKAGAGDLCALFDSGGGRVAAAGINYLPEADLERFLRIFVDHFSHPPAAL